jgi:hypothetical protein
MRRRHLQGRSKGGGQVGPAHPRILLAHPKIKIKHIKNTIHLQYLAIICLWFKIWPTPAKNHCYALDTYTGCLMKNASTHNFVIYYPISMNKKIKDMVFQALQNSHKMFFFFGVIFNS